MSLFPNKIRRMPVSIIVSFLFFICGLLFFLYTPYEAYGSSGDLEDRMINAVKRAKPAVVNITTGRPGTSSTGVGTGIIINRNGFILTNTHVIKGAAIIKVTLHDNTRYNAVLWKASPDNDLALLKIEATNLSVPSFGNSDNLQLGQIAIAIGNPYRFKWTVTMGVISALNRQVKARGISYTDLIQTDAAVNRGSSGGALINTSGQVIGINTLVYTGTSDVHAQGLSFAIPINFAIKIANELMTGQKAGVPKPWIGLSGKDITEQLQSSLDLPARYGVYITQVSPNSPASKGKIQPGDIIISAKGQLIRTVKDLKNITQESVPGQEMQLEYWRGRTKQKASIIVEQLSQ